MMANSLEGKYKAVSSTPQLFPSQAGLFFSVYFSYALRLGQKVKKANRRASERGMESERQRRQSESQSREPESCCGLLISLQGVKYETPEPPSSTLNLPSSAPPDAVAWAFLSGTAGLARVSEQKKDSRTQHRTMQKNDEKN